MTIIAALLLTLVTMIPGKSTETADQGSTQDSTPVHEETYGDNVSEPDTAEDRETTGAATEPTEFKGFLYLVIDDVGYNLDQLEQFLALPIPITYAILPQIDHTVSSYRRILNAGEEVILHQPFEPVGDQDPGPGALYVDMEPDFVRRTLRENLSQLPEAVGMNNHMGSRGTADGALLDQVMLELRSRGRGFYFLDSRTTAESRVEEIAEKHSILHSGRNVFLDNSTDPEDIRAALESSLEMADTRGFVVMIGHVWCPELATELSLWYEDVRRRGYVFSHLSTHFYEEAVHAGPGG